MTEDTTADRPLVTFALFAYNQENYIREAVEGAFSQTYEPLEIILSDDCSSDRTFEIMQEMAAAYTGKHEVKVLQTEQNIGVVPHVLLRGMEALGEIVVVAAGDDISMPRRVETHVLRYGDPSVWGISGGFDLIDEGGALVSAGETRPVGLSSRDSNKNFFLNVRHPYVVIQGSTASYRKSLFQIPMPDWPIIFSEDNLLNFLIYVKGRRVDFISEALVKYRIHDRALSNKGKKKIKAVTFERDAESAARRDINKMATFQWIADQSKDGVSVDIDAIDRKLRAASEIASWGGKSFLARCYSIIEELSHFKAELLKWKAVRVFGRCPNYQPKIFLSRFQSRHL